MIWRVLLWLFLAAYPGLASAAEADWNWVRVSLVDGHWETEKGPGHVDKNGSHFSATLGPADDPVIKLEGEISSKEQHHGHVSVSPIKAKVSVMNSDYIAGDPISGTYTQITNSSETQKETGYAELEIISLDN